MAAVPGSLRPQDKEDYQYAYQPHRPSTTAPLDGTDPWLEASITLLF